MRIRQEEIKDLIKTLSPRIQKELTPIGGHKVFHREGNSWAHTQRVMHELSKISSWGPQAGKLIGLIHDIGKSRGFAVDKDGWFTYPNHSRLGGEMLEDYISPTKEYFPILKWLVSNHIKTLFIHNNERKELENLWNSIPEGFDKNEAMTALLELGIADIRGSRPMRAHHMMVSRQADLRYLMNLRKRFIR